MMTSDLFLKIQVFFPESLLLLKLEINKSNYSKVYNHAHGFDSLIYQFVPRTLFWQF